MKAETVPSGVIGHRKSTLARMASYKHIYIILLPTVLFYLIFRYMPMFGNIIAFQKFSITKGILESDFVGLKILKIFYQIINLGSY